MIPLVTITGCPITSWPIRTPVASFDCKPIISLSNFLLRMPAWLQNMQHIFSSLLWKVPKCGRYSFVIPICSIIYKLSKSNIPFLSSCPILPIWVSSELVVVSKWVSLQPPCTAWQRCRNWPWEGRKEWMTSLWRHWYRRKIDPELEP